MDTPARLRQALAGRYELGGEAGSGGMATVYAAEDLKHQRKVAIKVLRPEIGEALGTERFLREIEIAARLQHPHILPVYDSGEAEGRLYYVMPFVEGESLRQRMNRERQLPLEDALRITLQAGEALAFAHARDVVHRDIKPENIMLTAGTVVVADFGIARALSAAGGSRLTQTGFTLGTPSYMSPEQASSDEVDGRSDQYSLGCVLYEMLAGSPPFHGATAQILLARHTLDAVPSLRAARPDLPSGIENVLRRALAKTPADRFRDIRGFLDALSKAAAGQSVELPATPATRRRLRNAVGLGVLILAAVLAGAFGLRGLLDRRPAAPAIPEVPRLAVLPFSHAGELADSFVTEGLTEEVRSRVAGLKGLRVIARASALRYRPEQGIKAIARELNVQYVITGTVRTDRAGAGGGSVRVTPSLIRVDGEEEVWSGGFDATFAPGGLFALQSAIAESVAARLTVGLSLPERLALQARPTDDAAAYEAFLRGNVYASRAYEEATSRLAVESFREAVTRDPRFALAHARLAQAQTMYYAFRDRAPARLDTAGTHIRSALKLDSTLLEAKLARGYLNWWGQLDATAALADLNAVRQATPSNSEVLWIIGNVQRRSGKWDEALETLQEAFELDPRSAIYALDLSTTSMVLRRYDDAMRYIDQSLALAPDAVAAVLQKSLLFWQRADSNGARRVVEEARPRLKVLDILTYIILRHPQYISVLGGDLEDSLERLAPGPGVPPPELHLAKAYSLEKRGDSVRARAHYDSARAPLEARVQATPREADFHSKLGVVYGGLGRREDAIREGDRAIELLPLEREAAAGVFPLTSRIRIALQTGETDVALRHLETLLRIPSVLGKTMVRADPFFSPLRGHPRFAELTRGADNRF